MFKDERIPLPSKSDAEISMFEAILCQIAISLQVVQLSCISLLGVVPTLFRCTVTGRTLSRFVPPGQFLRVRPSRRPL